MSDHRDYLIIRLYQYQPLSFRSDFLDYHILRCRLCRRRPTALGSVLCLGDLSSGTQDRLLTRGRELLRVMEETCRMRLLEV